MLSCQDCLLNERALAIRTEPQPPSASVLHQKLKVCEGGDCSGLSWLCCKEKSILTPCWSCFFSWFSLLFVTILLYIMACLREPYPSAWLLKCLCSGPCLPGRKEEMNTFPWLRLTILGDIFEIKWPFYFVSSPPFPSPCHPDL